MQEGVIGPLDFKVAQRAAGANMSVDVGMPAGGEALVQGDAVTGQGLYTVPCHSATVNEAVTAAHATLPRVDQVLLRVRDNTHDASGVNAADVFVLAGTATSGATRDNRAGAAVLPPSCMRLADVLVPAAAVAVVTADIRDRRPWARGALSSAVSTVNLAGTNGGATQSVPVTQRIECSGAPLDLLLKHGLLQLGSGAPVYGIHAQLMIDGVLAWEPVTPINTGVAASTYTTVTPASHRTLYTPSPGSHLFVFQFALDNHSVAGQVISAPFELGIREIVRVNASNG